MAIFYYDTTASGISDSASNWTVVLATSTSAAGTQDTNIAGQSSETDYTYSHSSTPNLAAWATATWTVEVRVNSGQNKLNLNIGLDRVD